MKDVQDRWLQKADVIDRVKAALTNGAPLSLIRIGDGEVRYLDYPNHTSLAKLEEINRIFFGSWPLADRHIDFIRSNLIASARGADIVGLFYGPVLRSSGHTEFHQILPAAVSYDLISRGAWLTYADLHYQLLVDGDFDQIFALADDVHLITSRRITAELAERYSLGKIITHYVPEEFLYAGDRDQFYKQVPHFPTRYFQIERELDAVGPRTLCLVGAGVLGKLYCNLVKDRGGVALDIGSVFDAWAGTYTRSQFRSAIANDVDAKFVLVSAARRLPSESVVARRQILIGASDAELDENSVRFGHFSPAPAGPFHPQAGESLASALAERPLGISLVDAQVFDTLARITPPERRLEWVRRPEGGVVTNALLADSLARLEPAEIESAEFSVYDHLDHLVVATPGQSLAHPATVDFRLSADAFWFTCAFTLDSPVPRQAFSTVFTLLVGGCQLVLRVGLGGVLQLVRLGPDESAVSLERFALEDSDAHRVAGGVNGSTLYFWADGYLFHPRTVDTANGTNAPRLVVGSALGGAYPFRGSIGHLEFGEGVLSAADLIAYGEGDALFPDQRAADI